MQMRWKHNKQTLTSAVERVFGPLSFPSVILKTSNLSFFPVSIGPAVLLLIDASLFVSMVMNEYKHIKKKQINTYIYSQKSIWFAHLPPLSSKASTNLSFFSVSVDSIAPIINRYKLIC